MQPDSWFIIGGIYESQEKRKWWKEVVADERVGITFDLYDIGLVFFNKNRYKQHYIVNFFINMTMKKKYDIHEDRR